MISQEASLPNSSASMLFDIKSLRSEGLTLSQIASKVNSNFETVRKICHKENIIKPRSISKRLSSGDKLSFRYKYLSGGYTNKHLAEYFEISIPSVKRLAKKMGLPKKYCNEYPKRKETMESVANLYGEGIGTYLIGKKLSICDETARRYLKKLGIKRREINGMSKRKISWQNRVIKEMYLNGEKLKVIEKAAKIGKHGIDKRLKAMEIARKRHPYNPAGNKYDKEIKSLFLDGLNFEQISKKIGIHKNIIPYRFRKHIFKCHSFKIKYYSKLTCRWRVSAKTYDTLRKVEHAKRRLRKYISPNVKIKILSFPQRVKAKSRFFDSIYENPILAKAEA